MTALLARWGNIKKDDHGNHCHGQRKRFLLFILSVGRIIGRESLAVLSQLSQAMADKKEETLLQVQGWLNGRISITVARSYSRKIRGARLPITLRER